MIARDYRFRVIAVFAFFCTLFVIIAVRLFLVQVKQKHFFKHLGQQQYGVQIKIQPSRGDIFDASGKDPLAFNRRALSAFLVPSTLPKEGKTLKMLKRYYPEVFKRYIKNPTKHFLWLARRMNDAEIAFLEKQADPSIHYLDEFTRYYPYQGAAQVVGLTDSDNHGIAGIELSFTQHLTGQPQEMRLERDARSGAMYFARVVKDIGRPGNNLALTIDKHAQEIVFYELQKKITALKAVSGTAVVLNPDTGAILAMANYPVFDPNKKGNIAFDAMKNRAVSECYEFGSVLKAFCALAALEEKVVALDEPIDCEGRFAVVDGVKVENPTISLLRRLEEHHNILPFNEVVRYSSNVGIAKVAKRLGTKYYDHLLRLGFGQKTGIQFPGERSGFVSPPHLWSRPSLIVMSFGYEIMGTIMQLARAACIIANGGCDIKPTLLQKDTDRKGRRLYGTESINGIKTIMQQVAERYPIRGMRVMGKTGTARCIVDGKYSTKIHQYSFIGIIEKGDYRRVIVTFVKQPEKSSLWASDVAVPIFHTIAQRLVVHDALHGAANLID
jgi:cell division protein FtsI (penicillin-binding protein 3)